MNFVSLHRICRTDKAFLFWSDGTFTFDTQIKYCLKLLLITLHKFAENIKIKNEVYAVKIGGVDRGGGGGGTGREGAGSGGEGEGSGERGGGKWGERGREAGREGERRGEREGEGSKERGGGKRG